MNGARSATTRRLSLLALLSAWSIAVAVAPAALAAPSKPIVIGDAGGDVSGPLHLTRVSLQRSSDGRLRVTLSFAAEIAPKALLARSGPPGSACLRVWTSSERDIVATRPDRLVCLTASSSTELRAAVYEVSGPELPKRLADVSPKLTASNRSVVFRVPQSALGRPARIRFAAESTRPGCAAVSCIDTVPDGAAARTFRLR